MIANPTVFILVILAKFGPRKAQEIHFRQWCPQPRHWSSRDREMACLGGTAGDGRDAETQASLPKPAVPPSRATTSAATDNRMVLRIHPSVFTPNRAGESLAMRLEMNDHRMRHQASIHAARGRPGGGRTSAHVVSIRDVAMASALTPSRARRAVVVRDRSPDPASRLRGANQIVDYQVATCR